MTEIDWIRECGQTYICIDCKNEFIYLGSGKLRKPRCNICNEELNRKRWRKASKKWRQTERGQKYQKERNRVNKLNILGTTSLGSHFSGDFEKERNIIKKEKHRLGLKGNRSKK